MSDLLEVWLYDQPAGSLERLSSGQLRFRYDDDYRSRDGATPLSLSMPLELGRFGHREIHPWLQGLLPDNDRVLTRWGQQFHVSPSSPFALLGTPIGLECSGAVQFRRASAGVEQPAVVDWLDEDGVAKRIRALREDQAAWTTRSTKGQFSLAGAQAKFALRREEGRWGMPSGSEPTTHILKPAIDGLTDHDLNEHLCLAAAGRVGLPVARTWVERFVDEAALVVERYDRIETRGRLVRLHQEDLCQALGVSPVRKYQNEGGPSPGDIAQLLRRTMNSGDADEAVRTFADGLIWNWLIGGTDAHAKNYSVLLVANTVRFAPLYDIASALPYGDHERKLKLAMKLGGSYDIYPAYNRWGKAAKELGLSADELTGRVEVLARRAPAAFAAAAEEVDHLGRDLPERLTDLIADRVARCIRMMETTKPLEPQ